MEVVTVVQLVSLLIGIAGSCYGFYKQVKARQLSNAWENASEALRGMVAAVELLPSDNATVQDVKRTIRGVSEQLGTEDGEVSKAVREVEAALRGAGFLPTFTETTPAQIERAAKAVAALRAKGGK